MEQLLCRDCRYWIQAENDPEHGECRHNPPTPIITQRVEGYMGPWNLKAYWPYSRKFDWCSKGEPMVIHQVFQFGEVEDGEEQEPSFNDLVEQARRKLAE